MAAEVCKVETINECELQIYVYTHTHTLNIYKEMNVILEQYLLIRLSLQKFPYKLYIVL